MHRINHIFVILVQINDCMGSSTPWIKDRWLPGVLNKEQLIALNNAHVINNIDVAKINNDASALDLHLSSKAWLMKRGSVKPIKKNYKSILSDSYYAEEYKPQADGTFLLETGHCYVFKIKEELLPYIKQTKFFGQSTAKSTVGRVDLIARVIVDGMHEYENFIPDRISSGSLYLEVSPITFNVKVKEGDSLSQLRFFYGEIDDSIIRNKDFIKSILNIESQTNLGTLSVNLSNVQLTGTNDYAAAFCAIKNVEDPLELWSKRKYSCKQFWENKVCSENDGMKCITIEEDRFYILRSKEKISLPGDVCIYCRAMDETLGEMRIHYAGFVHPYFGINRADGKEGAPLIFEVRGHNVKVLLTDEEILARLYIYRMSETAPSLPKSTPYSNQDLTLSNLFKENWND